MDVTILIAPKGCTRNPVVFKPSVHVFTVPDGVDVDVFLEKVVDKISLSYHNGVYFGHVCGRDYQMDDFREYVMHCEQKRCERERNENIKLAYAEVVSMFNGKGDFSQHRATLNHLLRRILPGINNSFCRWILCQSATREGIVDLEGFHEIIREAESAWASHVATRKVVKV